MKRIRYFFLILLTGIATCAMAQTPVDSLRDASFMRPLDLVQEDVRWNMATTDLFTTWLSNGLYGFYGPQPTILVDGIPVDANFLGWQNLNMLPIFIGNVEETTSRFVPQIYHHTLASGGLINFKTAPVDTGWSGSVSYYVGNETGDPGPYVYDSLKTTPNIDRWGPDAAVSVAYGYDGWYSKGVFIFRKHQPTDLNSNLRLHITNSLLGTNEGYVNHPIYIESKSGLFETGYHTDRWSIRGRYSFGTSEDYLFFQPFGREVPAKTAFQQAALQASYRFNRWLVEGSYIAHHKTIEKRVDLHSYIFDWEQWTHTTALSGQYEGDWFRLKSGIIYEQLLTGAPGIDDEKDVITTFYVNGRLPLGNSTLYMQNNLDFHRKTIAGTVRLGSSLQLTDHWNMEPQIFYSQVLPIRQHAFAYWASRGYTFGKRLGIAYDGHSMVYENKLLAIHLRNQFTLSPHFSLILEQQLTHHYWFNVPWQIVEYNRATHTRPESFTVTRTSGDRLSLMTQLQHTISNQLQQTLSLHTQRTLSGGSRYKAYFEQIPETKLIYQLDIRPVSGLLLSLNASYRSSTRWKEFEAIEGEEYRLPVGIPIRDFSGTFHTQTPSYFDVGLSVQKWFFDHHFSTQFSVQNLFNDEVRMHPMGAKLATKFNVKIGLRF